MLVNSNSQISAISGANLSSNVTCGYGNSDMDFGHSSYAGVMAVQAA